MCLSYGNRKLRLIVKNDFIFIMINEMMNIICVDKVGFMYPEKTRILFQMSIYMF